MRNTELLPTEPATPEYVLAVIRDAYRHSERLDPESEPDMELTFASTITEWRIACDLVRWRPLGRSLNRWFDISVSDSEWRAVLEPSSRHTLRDVCQLIAAHARRPCPAPFRIAGKPCEGAGTFLVLRTMLRRTGVGVDDVTPSTPLEAVARQHMSELLTAAGRLIPGAIPTPTLEHARRYDLAWILAGSALVGFLAAAIFRSSAPTLIWLSIALFICAAASTWIFSGAPLRGATFGSVRTFGDLVRVSLASPKGAA